MYGPAPFHTVSSVPAGCSPSHTRRVCASNRSWIESRTVITTVSLTVEPLPLSSVAVRINVVVVRGRRMAFHGREASGMMQSARGSHEYTIGSRPHHAGSPRRRSIAIASEAQITVSRPAETLPLSRTQNWIVSVATQPIESVAVTMICVVRGSCNARLCCVDDQLDPMSGIDVHR